jgi:hypothetical protein
MSAHTVVMCVVGRDANPRHSRPYYVEAGSTDAAICRAWDKADSDYGRDHLVLYPVSVNGVECDAEVNWNAVRAETEDAE